MSGKIFLGGGIVRHRGRPVSGMRLPGLAIFICIFVVGAAQMSGVSAAESGIVAPPDLPEHRPESRLLRLRHHWTGERLRVVYKIGGEYQPGAMAEINHFLRDWRCDKTITMDPRLIDQLYELQQAVGERRTIRIISAYRSEGYNASLLRAGHNVDPNSQHMFGRAADVFVPGLSLARLRTAAEAHRKGGIGFYPFSGPRFIHIDTGPKRQWAEMDPGERRRLGLPKRPRKRLKLDCSLRMAEVLRDIPVSEVLAALPAGASIRPAGDLHKISFSPTGSNGDEAYADREHSEDGEVGQKDDAHPCELSGRPQPLDPAALVYRRDKSALAIAP